MREGLAVLAVLAVTPYLQGFQSRFQFWRSGGNGGNPVTARNSVSDSAGGNEKSRNCKAFRLAVT